MQLGGHRAASQNGTPGKHTTELVSSSMVGGGPECEPGKLHRIRARHAESSHQVVGGLSTLKPTEAQGSLLLISEAWNPHHQTATEHTLPAFAICLAICDSPEHATLNPDC